MRREQTRRRMVAVATAVLVVASGFVVGTRPTEAAGPVRVMQYNVCGAICNKGVAAKPGNNNDVVDDVRGRILASRPHLVMLHEGVHRPVPADPGRPAGQRLADGRRLPRPAQ